MQAFTCHRPLVIENEMIKMQSPSESLVMILGDLRKKDEKLWLKLKEGSFERKEGFLNLLYFFRKENIVIKVFYVDADDYLGSLDRHQREVLIANFFQEENLTPTLHCSGRLDSLRYLIYEYVPYKGIEENSSLFFSLACSLLIKLQKYSLSNLDEIEMHFGEPLTPYKYLLRGKASLSNLSQAVEHESNSSRKQHNIDMNSTDIDITSIIHKLNDTLELCLILIKRWTEITKGLLKKRSPTLVHGDLNSQNTVALNASSNTLDDFRFIDWEYAGFSYSELDIAVTLSHYPEAEIETKFQECSSMFQKQQLSLSDTIFHQFLLLSNWNNFYYYAKYSILNKSLDINYNTSSLKLASSISAFEKKTEELERN